MTDDTVLTIITPEEQSRAPKQTDPYTAVVYFHGMGQQRRHEEVSTLIERITTLLCKRTNLTHTDFFLKQGVVFEKKTKPDDRPIAYQEMHIPNGDGPLLPHTPQNVRFYEVYWAPRATGGTNAFSVFYWVAQQWCVPGKALLAPWHEMQPIRLGTLHNIYEKDQLRNKSPNAELAEDVNTLTKVYRSFGESDNRCDSDMCKGDFKAFKKYLDKQLKLKEYQTYQQQPQRRTHIKNLAQRWKRRYICDQVKFLTATTTLLLLVCSLLALIGLASLMFLGVLFRIALPVTQFAWPSVSDLLWLPLGLVLWFVLSKLKVVLAHYLGDVEQYVTYQETDTKYARHEDISNYSKTMLRHVLADTNCTRVVVIAHSLGAVIALDALLSLRNEVIDLSDPKADDQITPTDLEKIQHFITMGSPINKVNYFFTTRSKVTRYMQVLNALRGDLSVAPFSTIDGKPHTHWVNYWDLFDLVSGPLLTISSRQVETQRVDNVCVASYHVPDPFRSHGGYFSHKHVLEDICRITFRNDYSFVNAQQSAPNTQEWLAHDQRYKKARLSIWNKPGKLVALVLKGKLGAHTQNVATTRKSRKPAKDQQSNVETAIPNS